RCVDLDAAGRHAVSGGGGPESDEAPHPVRLWDVEAARCLRTLGMHGGGVTAARLSGDGAWALSGGADGLLRVWDVGRGEIRHAFGGPPDGVTAAAFDPARGRAFAAAADGSLRVWDVVQGRCDRVVEARAGGPSALAVASDGRHLLVGGG